MTPNDYQEAARRTCLEKYDEFGKVADIPALQHIIHAHFGMSSETGEIGDAIKKAIIYGQTLDVENLVEECGDLMWYIALMLSTCSYTMEECMEENIAKLKIRYPEKFTEHHAAARLDKSLKAQQPTSSDSPDSASGSP